MQVSDAKEKEAIAHLTEQLKEHKFYDEKRHDRYLLLRFLRARKFDLEKSTKMILECEKWRIDCNLENIVQTYVSIASLIL